MTMIRTLFYLILSVIFDNQIIVIFSPGQIRSKCFNMFSDLIQYIFRANNNKSSILLLKRATTWIHIMIWERSRTIFGWYQRASVLVYTQARSQSNISIMVFIKCGRFCGGTIISVHRMNQLDKQTFIRFLVYVYLYLYQHSSFSHFSGLCYYEL